MSSRTIWITGLSTAAAAMLLMLAYGIHTSAYFMWAGLPAEAPVKLFVDNRTLASAQLAALAAPQTWNRVFPFLQDSVARAAVSSGAGPEHAVILPTFTSQFRLSREVREQGWQTRRVGLLLLAQRGKETEPMPAQTLLRQGLTSVVSRAVKDRLPLQPEVLLSLKGGSVKFLTDPIAVVGYAKRNALVFHARPEGWSQENIPLFNPLPGLHAAFPGPLLNVLPAQMKDDWNEFLRREFHFTASHPDIIAGFSTLPRVELHITATGASLGAPSAEGSFLRLSEEWVGNEAAHRTPETAAFRLPDGTLGYEKRPSLVAAAFREVSDAQGCRESVLPTAFLCRGTGTPILSTTRDVVSLATTPFPVPSADWYVVLDETLSQKLAIPNVTSVIAWGNSESATLMLPYPTKE